MSGDHYRISKWEQDWSVGDIGFHQRTVHNMLEKHIDKLKGNGKVEKIFFPLCGKAIDMKWLSDQGMTVIGVDAVPKALEEFFGDNNLEYTEMSAPTMGPNCKLFQSKDEKIKLYCGDVFLYNESLNGKFDAIWDRGALVALNRPDVAGYTQLLKSLLNPGGRILLEVFQYDLEVLAESKHPPPHPMFEDEIRSLYEPECTVEKVDHGNRTLADKPVELLIYLITKK